jgi:hypothetical protein
LGASSPGCSVGVLPSPSSSPFPLPFAIVPFGEGSGKKCGGNSAPGVVNEVDLFGMDRT